MTSVSLFPENPSENDVQQLRWLQVCAMCHVPWEQEVGAQEQLHGGVLRTAVHALQ